MKGVAVVAPLRRHRGPFRCLVLGLVVALSVAGCAAFRSDGDEIVLVTGRDASSGGLIRILANWRDRHPDIRVRVRELSRVADQQHDALVKDAQDGSATSDVYSLDVTWVTEFAKNDYIAPLDRFDIRPFLPGPARTGLYPPAPDHTQPPTGSQWAVPYTTDVGLLYVRRDLIDPPPTSWEDLRRSAATVQGHGPVAVWAGQLDDYEGLTVNVLEALGQVAPGQTLFDAGIGKLRQAIDLMRPVPGTAFPTVLPDSLTYDESASIQAMRDGKVATVRNWPADYRTLTTGYTEDPGRAGLFDIAQVPGGRPVLGGQDLAISRHSSDPDQAQELIAFMTSAESEQILRDAGAAPTRADSYDASTPLTTQIRTALDHSVSRPEGVCYTQFSALFHQAVHDSLSTGAPVPDDLLDRLGRALDCKPDSGQ